MRQDDEASEQRGTEDRNRGHDVGANRQVVIARGQVRRGHGRPGRSRMLRGVRVFGPEPGADIGEGEGVEGSDDTPSEGVGALIGGTAQGGHFEPVFPHVGPLIGVGRGHEGREAARVCGRVGRGRQRLVPLVSADEAVGLIEPGREDDDAETKLYSKQEYRERGKENSEAKPEVRDDAATHDDQAVIILEGLGGKDNIVDVTNCVTRLRVNVKDESLVKDDNFLKKSGALGVARNGKAIQVIIGFSVGQVRESFEKLLK